jgi:hypothetical protein
MGRVFPTAEACLERLPTGGDDALPSAKSFPVKVVLTKKHM